MLAQYSSLHLLFAIAASITASFCIGKVCSLDDTLMGKCEVLTIALLQVPTIVCLYELINRNL